MRIFIIVIKIKIILIIITIILIIVIVIIAIIIMTGKGCTSNCYGSARRRVLATRCCGPVPGTVPKSKHTDHRRCGREF